MNARCLALGLFVVLIPRLGFAAIPLFPGTGNHHREITTESKEAQSYFDQGLRFVFAFNHDEAIRSFAEATRLDPASAMAYWGIALANGPHINNPAMSDDQSRGAWVAIERARELAGGASETERALIEALRKRYTDPPPSDRKAYDVAYADAMRELWKTYPKDPDIGALFAEAMMDLRPWDLWLPDGAPQPGTDEILGALENVLALDPNHPLANHLYIHAVEASPHPEKGIASADRLRTLVPGAGHLVHMPAHIYSRIGRWEDAAKANEVAVEADRAYLPKSPNQGFYYVYVAHNHHFLSWASQMEGRSEAALRAAREMIAALPEAFVRDLAFFADGFMLIEIETLMRFGRWQEILAVPEPPTYLPITGAYTQFARATALAALGRVPEAEAAQAAFRKASAAITDEMIVGNNPARLVISIADHQLEGEILNRKGQVDDAVRELKEAVRLEDSLRYDEAPDWLLPVRHALGAVLVRASRWPEAEAVYREDLTKNAENGWSLWGLQRCLHAQQKDKEAALVEARFKKAWKRADVSLESTCFCQIWK